jgi:hypothetical protein
MKALPKIFLAIWGLFILSFFLPAVRFDGNGNPIRGWQCAWLCAKLFFDFGPNYWQAADVYYGFFTVPNVIMLLSPLVLLTSMRKGTMGWIVTGLSIFSVLYVLSFWVVGAVNGQIPCRIGYYLWFASFAAFCAAMFRLMQRDRTSPPTPLSAPA